LADETGALDEAPPFEALAAELLQLLHGRLFIAHNARLRY
jgi:DNA polymerase-3 subunit epsilon